MRFAVKRINIIYLYTTFVKIQTYIHINTYTLYRCKYIPLPTHIHKFGKHKQTVKDVQ